MEQHFQDVAQKVMNNNNLDYCGVHFSKQFTQNQVHNNIAKLRPSELFLW